MYLRMEGFAKKIWESIKEWMSASLKWRNALIFSLFLLIATLMWYVHALNSVRERTIEVGIVYTGIGDNIAFETELPTTLKVRLRDTGKRLLSYTDVFSKPIEFDLGEQLGRKGTLYISADQIRPRINDQLQGTTKLQEVIPEVISSRYYTELAKSVPIVFVGETRAAQQYELKGDVRLRPSSIKVYGSKDVLDSIREIRTERVEISGIRDTVRMELSLEPIAGVRYSQSTVEMRVVALQYTERVFVCPIICDGLRSDQSVRLFPSTAEVRTRVDMRYYSEVGADDLRVYCKYTGDSDAKRMELRAESKNSHLQVVRLSPSNVEYIIEKR